MTAPQPSEPRHPQAAVDPDLASSASGTAPRTARLWQLACFVLVGGALGTAARAALVLAFPTASGFPWTVFAINLGGAFLLGALLEALARRGPDSGVRKLSRLTIGTGFCGGFTTYSTFAVETADLLGTQPGVGVGYALGTVIVGAAATIAGMLVGRALGERRSRA